MIEKEKEYLADLKGFYKYEESGLDEEEEINGVFIPKKLITKNSKRSCPVCNVYSFKSNDDVYMSKFDCCEKCYIQWVEGRGRTLKDLKRKMDNMNKQDGDLKNG
jgi:hypothetical protein